MEPRLGIALALSSGGARGFVHIGILKVLDRHGVRIAGIAGSSMGALIGALYCSGYTGSMLEEIALEVRRSHYLDFSFSKMGFVAGKKLHAMVTRLTAGKRFEDCSPPLKMVAVDIERAEEVVIDQGPLADGVRASAAVPGMFSPVNREGRLLVDGGVLNRVPADLARTFPSAGVVAVDVGVDLAPRVSSVFDVLFQTFDIMARELRRYQTISADILIAPHLDLSRDRDRARRFIRAGEEAGERAMPAIARLAAGAVGGGA